MWVSTGLSRPKQVSYLALLPVGTLPTGFLELILSVVPIVIPNSSASKQCRRALASEWCAANHHLPSATRFYGRKCCAPLLCYGRAEIDMHSKPLRFPQPGVQAEWRKVNHSASEHVQALQLGQDDEDACQQAAGAPHCLACLRVLYARLMRDM